MRNGIFVTATGTDVGKTYVSALLVKALREQGINAGYFKPALSGALREGDRLIPGDAEFVCQFSGLPGSPEQYVACLYEHAVSPHLAARLEHRPVTKERIMERLQQVQKDFDYVVVEGCGGLFCPLCTEGEPLLLTDVVRLINFDLLVVSGSGLGSIHAAVTTVEYARMQGFTVREVVMNRFQPGNEMQEDNRVQIERFTGIKTICINEDAQTITFTI